MFKPSRGRTACDAHGVYVAHHLCKGLWGGGFVIEKAEFLDRCAP